jgi:dolichol-phosphate mannosyltransferase
MRTGFQHATGDIVVCYDADCTYPVDDILILALHIGDDADIVTASPYHSKGTTAIPFHRLLPSKVLSLMYRTALRGRTQGIATFSCAFRAYKRPVLTAIDFQADGFLAASEILVRALLQGFRVVEIPSTLSDRKYGVSKMRFLPTVWSHLGLLGHLVWQDITRQKRM